MPRVHCPDCAGPVVLDPDGMCPEGHLVGPTGARVESAIGSDTFHPDEPQPWVARVELDDEPDPDAELVAARTARPLAAPLATAAPAAPAASAAAAPAAAVDTDELLRELHALADLDGFGGFGEPSGAATPAPQLAPAPAPAAVPAPASATAPVPAAPASPATAAPAVTGPATWEGASGLDELTALEAAVQALGADTPPLVVPVPTPHAPPTPVDVAMVATPVPQPPVPQPPVPQLDAPQAPAPPAPPAAWEAPTAPDVEAPAEPVRPTSVPDDRPLDLASFTAKGRKVGGGKRRLFGR